MPTNALVQQFVVKETSDLDVPDLTGTRALEVDPGEERTLAEYEPQSDQAYLLALGATDHDNSEYRLYFDNDRKGVTRSSLGLVNDPFSCLGQLGVVPPFNELVEYKVRVDESASDSLTFAGRIFVTERDPRRGQGGGR